MTTPRQPKLRLKDRKRRLMWVKVAAGSSVVALSIGLMWYGSHVSEVIISKVEVTGTQIVSTDAVKNETEALLKGSYAYFIPRANSFVYPKTDIKNAILKKLPPVESVEIERDGLTALKVVVTERKPVALWCGDVIPESEQLNCYLLDANGFIFGIADSQNNYIRFYGHISGEPVGQTYLSGTFTPLFGLVRDISTAIRMTPTSLTADKNTNDMTLRFDNGGELRFVFTENRQATLENIASVFASQSFKTNKNFEYVDFRFGDKVYVKFKGE